MELAILILVLAAASGQADVVVPVSIDFNKPVAHTSAAFLSVTIDAGEIGHNFSGLDFTSASIINMAKALTPAVLRFGGSAEDHITYNMSAGPIVEQEHPSPSGMDRLYSGEQVTMSRQQWDYLNGFAKATGLALTFGLNAQRRRSGGAWEPSNAEELIQYTKTMGYDVNYELGNEPDLYFEHSDMLNVTGKQMALDFKALAKYFADSGLRATLAGPDVATLNRAHFFEDFLSGLEDSDIPNIITWHQYYGDGKKFKLADFHSAAVLDKLMEELDFVHILLKNNDKAKTEVWLGETSSCYGGGTPGLSDAFVAGFMWLDKLGITALYNYTHICRQTFWGGSYSLIDSKTGKPLPDFFASIAYKQLMDERVLGIEGQLKTGRTTRVYAHCAKILPGSGLKPGAVTIMALNIDNTTSAQLRIDSRFDHTVVAQYLFQSTDGSPTSQSVMLNRFPLSLIDGKTVPTLRPKLVVIPTDGTIQVPPMSYAFFVLPTANATACL